MKSWLSMLHASSAELNALVSDASRAKNSGVSPSLQGKTFAMMFFNHSLRTRTSFEVAASKLGAKVVSLSPGKDTWNFELEDDVPMDKDKSEHIGEMAPVISRYFDVLGVRSFADLQSLELDAQEKVIASFSKYATVPLINLESAMEHPCQALADMLTLKEKLGETKGKKFVLSWVPHIKPTPMAVSHSALLAAAHSGMDITLAHPEGYELYPAFVDQAQAIANSQGGNFKVTDEQTTATKDADVVYIKSWGAAKYYGDLAAQSKDFKQKSDWRMASEKLGSNTKLMHCLPVRREIEVTKEALTGKHSIVVDQAENRLWAQIAILQDLFKE